MNKVLAFVQAEPVTVWVGLVQSAITLGVAFGMHLSAPQTGAILAFTNVALAVVTRSQVSPKA